MTYENSFDTLSKEDKLDKDIRQTVAAYHWAIWPLRSSKLVLVQHSYPEVNVALKEAVGMVNLLGNKIAIR